MTHPGVHEPAARWFPINPFGGESKLDLFRQRLAEGRGIKRSESSRIMLKAGTRRRSFMTDPAGYRGKALAFLRKAGAGVGNVLAVETKWGSVSGTLVPRYTSADETHIVLKLKSGYNVGLDVSGLVSGKVVAKGEPPSFKAPPLPGRTPGLPKVLLLGTGGTIASRIDYRTGAVHPAVDASNLHALVPELSEAAAVDSEIVFNVFSENMSPAHWSKLAKRVAKAPKEGYQGVVVTHGTDTLGYTAAALSFALAGIGIPVILTAAQRSSDRPSSDATLNLIGAVSVAAKAPFAGVYLAAHLDENDGKIAIHAGTRVRKDHTSRRDAFRTVGGDPVAVWSRDGFEHIADGLSRRSDDKFVPRPGFSDGAALLKFHPSMSPKLLAFLKRSGKKAVVVEGTGLGHVGSEVVAALKRFTTGGGLAFMTSQCINGRVDLDVYDTGRDLKVAGVVPLEDMLSETALTKASWALANARGPTGAKDLMLKNVAGEMDARRFPG